MVPAPGRCSKPVTQPDALVNDDLDFILADAWIKSIESTPATYCKQNSGNGDNNVHGIESIEVVAFGTEAKSIASTTEPAGTSASLEVDHGDLFVVNERREYMKSVCATIVVFLAWICLFGGLGIGWSDFIEPDCDTGHMELAAADVELRSCDVCGRGTLLLPVFGEYEKAWDKGFRAALYFAGLLFVFIGMTMICDTFVAAIEHVTSAEHKIMVEVRPGSRTQFRVKVWNGTVANLTLMALGSSAPEILLSITELMGNDFFAGSLGPSTIIGSAAFNLFVISAVCVSAIAPPEVRKIDGVGVFLITASVSLFAYIWLLIMLLVITPNKVDLWEGVVTLLFFPILVFLAFAADKGWILSSASGSANEASASDERMLHGKFGEELADNDTLRQHAINHMKSNMSSAAPNKTRSQLRSHATSMLTGGHGKALSWALDKSKTAIRTGKKSSEPESRVSTTGSQTATIGFVDKKYTVFEDAGTLTMTVNVSRPLDQRIRVRFFTREGSAKEGMRYSHTEGVLTFLAGVTQKDILISVIDNNEWEPDEEFYVELELESFDHDWSSMGSNKSEGEGVDKSVSKRSSTKKQDVTLTNNVATVVVLNDDIPGMLTFDFDQVCVDEGVTVNLGVVRQRGKDGEITVDYETVDGDAQAEKDYTPAKGTLYFAHGETHKTIQIPILVSANHEFEAEESFRLELTNPSPGVIFDSTRVGGVSKAVCEIVILASNEPVSCWVQFLRKYFNRDKLEVICETWAEQIREAFYCGGTAGDQAEAGLADWFFHMLGLFWKVLFMWVPPPIMGGGWPCFISSLVMIGSTTALAGDIASLLGCCLNVPDDITAITLVALGTSLPDTLASRAAAQADENADNAIGNITGSNCVNVFLGLGVAWTIGAVYWEIQGPTTHWKEHLYKGESFESLFLSDYSKGGFFVPAGISLGFSVAVYTICAIACLIFFYVRRKLYGGELGGPALSQKVGFAFLTSLWIIYLACSIVYSLSSS